MTAESEGRAKAEDFRRRHRLGHQPLGDLVALIEQTTGYDVAVLDVPAGEHGMTMRDPERGAVFIAIASTPHPMRQRSTLAHELAHVLFEDWADHGDEGLGERRPEEIRADAFARHLLIPRRGAKDFTEGRVSGESTLSAVVQHFLVSPALAVIAMHQADLISESQKVEWGALTTSILAARFGWSDQYRALQAESRQRRAPQRLLARAIEGYAEQVVSLRTLAMLRRCDDEAIEAELRGAGIEPGEVEVRWARAADLRALDVDLSDFREVNEDTSR